VRIEWTPAAEASALAIADYISIDAPLAALAIHEEIHRQVALLGDYPHMGRPGRCAGTRELVIARTPYIVAYRLERLAVVVLRVLHGAQRWPRVLRSGSTSSSSPVAIRITLTAFADHVGRRFSPLGLFAVAVELDPGAFTPYVLGAWKQVMALN